MAYESNQSEGLSVPSEQDRLTFSDLALLLFYGSAATMAMVTWLWFLGRLSGSVIAFFAGV
jgi:uncharacterized membrane protein YjjP (DUF1212 family)